MQSFVHHTFPGLVLDCENTVLTNTAPDVPSAYVLRLLEHLCQPERNSLGFDYRPIISLFLFNISY